LLDGTERSFIHVGDKNGSRLPDYHRMDFAISYEYVEPKKEQFSGRAGISFFNVYNRRNIKYKRYQLLEYDPQTFMPIKPELVQTDVLLLGFVPNLFINLNF